MNRAPWTQSCQNCQHYKEGECTLLKVAVHKLDWCDSYKKADN